MEATVLVAIVVALFASALTPVSGFGLGTLLLPAFALLFELEVAVATTAIVHPANNLWKGVLFRHDPDWSIVPRFGGPALIGALAGSWPGPYRDFSAGFQAIRGRYDLYS